MKKRNLFLMALALTMCMTSGCGSRATDADSATTSSATTSSAATSSAAASAAVENSAVTTEAESSDVGEESAAAVSEGSSVDETALSDTNDDSSESVSNTKSTREMTDLATGSMLPTSSEEYLDEEDISGLTPYQLRIARNEIFARHGRIFTDGTLSSYFGDKSWYEGTMEAAEFDAQVESILNEYELANINLIEKRESAVSGNYYASVDETWKMISSGSFSDMEYGENTSEYCFYLYFDEAEDCGDYYEIPCEIERPAVFDEELSIGESTTICGNDLTNESIELTRVSEDEFRCSDDWSYRIYNDILFIYDGSDDMVYFPCYVGTIRVEKDALIGDGFEPETLSSSGYDAYSDWFFNGVDFNSEGCATTLINYGD